MDLYQYDTTGNTMVTFLRNILSIPLYQFNAMMWQLPTSLNISELELPAENYVKGTYASSQLRSVPETWTVWTYIGLCAGMLLIILGIHGWAMQDEIPEKSAFPMPDLWS
ncbi:uncharacterized protein LY89DRAFT_687558 [Mollisia scopiformis]|uniref:Uncharacterized protein n=1 Tax=Mollisia scopiformis TaxID=149040 RepID=A0A194X0S2_MOLSC|nr:uncharacterized protein LY89DRAFT_687558 [Mollisia scopiformis]KUJ13462.1 hypothetical protein LY89DRAFT_687558 [Mollisia scopiformis]